MTKTITLKALTRGEKEGTPRQLRKKGFIPVNLYGAEIKNQNLKIKQLDFESVYDEAGESSLVDLTIDKSGPIKIIIKEVQRDITKDTPIHADFYQVDMKKEITTEIPILIKGESPAVKELGGTLVTYKDSIEVECLPGNLINEIVVDISNLAEFNDMVKIKDISLPEGVKATSDDDEVIVGVSAPRIEIKAEAEEEVGEGEADEAAPEGEKKDEGEPGKEEKTEEQKK